MALKLIEQWVTTHQVEIVDFEYSQRYNPKAPEVEEEDRKFIYVLRGEFVISGLTKEFARYEKSIFSGKIPCPFTVEFKDREGNVVARNPIPLTLSGKPKFDLFGKD